MSKQRIGIALLAILLLSIICIAPGQAQAQGSGWSQPYRLSSDEGKSSEGYLVADQYGYVHCFWTETLFENGSTVIKYARFDGTTWTQPNDIYLTGDGIRNISPIVDHQGILHIAWSEGLFNVRVYYTHAAANNAISAQAWAKPIQIDLPARPVYLRVDSKGIFHVLYTNQTEESGIYYIRSEDSGLTWSDPFWIDPDILPGHNPDSLSFEIDENDGLHAVWVYAAVEQGAAPDWVRYSHSLDGGHTWSEPFLIDQQDVEQNHLLTSSGPRMIVQGQSVHVIWAAGQLPYRYHRFSTDGGLTWSPSIRILGDLHGQAGDGLAVDSAGRVHYFAQIRYPMGIYHTSWDESGWSAPSLLYLIAEEDAIPDFSVRVHAHDTLPVIRAGNQLVLTFADGPADEHRRLFVMYHTLDDIASLEGMPTPVPTATPIPASSPTPSQSTLMPSPTATALSFEFAASQPLEGIPAPDHAIWVALVPTLFVLGVTVVFQWLNRRKD